MIPQADKLRAALADLSQGGLLSFELKAVKARPEYTKAALGWLRRTKEVVKRADGKMEYHPQTTGQSGPVSRIYRAARAYKGPFTAADIARIAEVDNAVAIRALKLLAKGGYLHAQGGPGLDPAQDPAQDPAYILTGLGRETPNPPAMIYRPLDFSQEKQAVARLGEIFLTADLRSAKAAKAILQQLAIIGRRFGDLKERDHD